MITRGYIYRTVLFTSTWLLIFCCIWVKKSESSHCEYIIKWQKLHVDILNRCSLCSSWTFFRIFFPIEMINNLQCMGRVSVILNPAFATDLLFLWPKVCTTVETAHRLNEWCLVYMFLILTCQTQKHTWHIHKSAEIISHWSHLLIR